MPSREEIKFELYHLKCKLEKRIQKNVSPILFELLVDKIKRKIMI